MFPMYPNNYWQYLARQPKPYFAPQMQQQQQQAIQPPQGGGGGNGPLNLSMLQDVWGRFHGMDGFGGAAGGEAAPLGLVGDYGGAAAGGAAAAGEGAAAAGEGAGAAAGGAAEGIGAGASALGEGLAGAGMGIMDALGALGMFLFSDPKLKENAHKVGKLNDGTPVWSYNYKGSPVTRIGLMANEVKRHHPEAVQKIGGYMAVNYEKATEPSRGLFSNLDR